MGLSDRPKRMPHSYLCAKTRQPYILSRYFPGVRKRSIWNMVLTTVSVPTSRTAQVQTDAAVPRGRYVRLDHRFISSVGDQSDQNCEQADTETIDLCRPIRQMGQGTIKANCAQPRGSRLVSLRLILWTALLRHEYPQASSTPGQDRPCQAADWRRQV